MTKKLITRSISLRLYSWFENNQGFSGVLMVCFFLFTSCTIYYLSTEWDYKMPYETNNISVEEAFLWTANNIKYIPDEDRDMWQLPHETYEKLTGDCEDQAILFMYIVYAEIGIERVELLVTKDHVVVRIDKIYYDPTNEYIGEKKEEWDILYSFNYGETMYQAMYMKN